MSILTNFLKAKLNDDLFNVCGFLLKFLNIKHANLYLKLLLTDHLNASSLLAVQDTLVEYGIKSGQLEKTEHHYHNE
ncbi:hypothetical protein DBR43_15300 [Pedobacter sp. KBW06]|nr:hypothetical protein DBR43_15300 [Pedobacter sp. KBW06]